MKSLDFLKEGFMEDASEAHQDHEVQMARQECFHAAEHALALHKLLRNISEAQGLEGWVSSKITLANDYLKRVREYLEYELLTKDINDEAPTLTIAEDQESKKKNLVVEYKVSGAEPNSENYTINNIDLNALQNVTSRYYDRPVTIAQSKDNPDLYKINVAMTVGPVDYGSYNAATRTASVAKRMTDKGDQLQKVLQGISEAQSEEERAESERQMQDFLAKGGEIQQVRANRGPRRSGASLASHHIGGMGDARTGRRSQMRGLGSNPTGKLLVAKESEGVAEGMEGQVVFSGSGADGGKYEIIQTGPTDFMIHANGKHIDTYSSLQRAMGVLKNEVSGLKKGVEEGVLDFFEKKPMPEHGDELKIGDRYVIFNDGGSYYGVSWIKQDRSEAYEEFNKSEYTDLNQLKKAIWDEIKYQDQRGVAEGSLNEGQYEMMMRNGQVKKFIAKDDADAKRIAAGHGAKSVIRLKGGVPAGKVTEQGMAEGLPGSLSKSDYTSGKTLKHTSSNCTACHGRKTMYKLDGKLYADNKAGATKVKCPTCKGTGDKQGVAEGSAPGQAAWKKEMIEKGAVSFKRDQHGGGTVDRIVAYDKDGKVVGGFNRKGVAEGAKCNHTMEGTKCPVHGLKECGSYGKVEEMSAGSVATVVNPPAKNKSKVGTLFGGTYKQKKVKEAKQMTFPGENTKPPQRPGDQVRGTAKATKPNPFKHRLVGNE